MVIIWLCVCVVLNVVEWWYRIVDGIYVVVFSYCRVCVVVWKELNISM